jgi:hypothetical protein
VIANNNGRTVSTMTGLGRALGITLMYLLDRVVGRPRRARLGDKIIKAGKKVWEAAEVTWRDATNRMQGVLYEGPVAFSVFKAIHRDRDSKASLKWV